MNRYETNKQRKDKDTGRTFYSTIMYPKIDRSSEDIYIRARYGDRLDILAGEYYNDVTLWWIIAQANGLGKGSLSIPAGKQLRIPMDTDEIINKFNDTGFIMSYSYGRALQQSALKHWAIDINDIEGTQKIFNHRAEMCTLAAQGKWSKELENI